MKKSLLLILGILLPQYIFAMDFDFTYKSQTLVYSTAENPGEVYVKKADYSITGEVIIPETVNNEGVEYQVTAIGENAFSFCSDLISVQMPTTIVEIKKDAFYCCVQLSNVDIPESVSYIGKGVFSSCARLTSVKLPDTITTIEDHTFSSCERLQSINIPDGVTSIGDGAFSFCLNLDSIKLPDSLITIGRFAFQWCKGLTAVTIPGKVEAIGDGAFGMCDSLLNIFVEEHNEYFTSVDGILFDKNLLTVYCCPAGKSGKYIIPEGTLSIANSAFAGCSDITTILFPSTINLIGNGAFSRCSGLTSVIIPKSVIELGASVFVYCSGLIKSAYPSTFIKPFYNGCAIMYEMCDDFTDDGFIYNYNDGTLVFAPIDLEGEFSIPKSISIIGTEAFLGCRELTSVTIPSSVTEIGDRAFKNCEGLNSIYYDTAQPIFADDSVFESDIFESIYKNTTLYVPTVAVEKCRQIAPWKNFSKIEPYDFAGVDAISTDINYNMPCEIYTICGDRVYKNLDSLTSGIYIVRQNSLAKKIVIP